MNLRSKMIHLAHEEPELRPHILPLLNGKTAAKDANVEFQSKLKVTQKLIDELKKALVLEARRQATDPRNWGYVGDLGHVNEELEEVIKFLNGVAQ